MLALFKRALGGHAAGWIASLLALGSFVLAANALLGFGETGALRQVLFSWGAGPFGLEFGLFADEIALWWLIVVTGVGFLIHVYSIEYMSGENGYARYFAELNYFIFAMSLLVLADNFVGLLLGWANVGFASFLLIGFWNQRPEALAAARKALLINVIGELGMVVALALVFAEFGTFEFATVFAGAQEAEPGIVTAIALLLLLGIVTKSAQVPLHTWLPDAMQGPTPVSALIHAATMVTAGVYLVARAYPLFQASPLAMDAVLLIGGVSAIFGAVVASRQFDIKRVLAYSTLSQLGFMFMAAGAGAYVASLLHFFTHAFFKALLFLGAGIVAHYLHGEQDIRKMGGLGRKLPFAYWTFLIGVLAIAGIPPFAGFFSKDEILAALLAEGHVALWLLGTVTAGITAYYMMRLFALVFAGRGEEHGDGHKSGALMNLPVLLLALLSIGAGLIAVPGLSSVPGDFLDPAFEVYEGHAVHAPGFGWPALVALAVSLVGMAIAVKMFGPAGSGRRVAQLQVGRRILGPVHNAFFIDHFYLWLAGRGAHVAGLVAAALQSGYVRRYAFTVFAGFAALLFYYALI